MTRKISMFELIDESMEAKDKEKFVRSLTDKERNLLKRAMYKFVEQNNEYSRYGYMMLEAIQGYEYDMMFGEQEENE